MKASLRNAIVYSHRSQFSRYNGQLHCRQLRCCPRRFSTKTETGSTQQPPIPKGYVNASDYKTGSIWFDTPITLVLIIGGFGSYLYHNYRVRKDFDRTVERIEEDMHIAPSELAQLRKENKMTPQLFIELRQCLKKLGKHGTVVDVDNCLRQAIQPIQPDGIVGEHHLFRALLGFFPHDEQRTKITSGPVDADLIAELFTGLVRGHPIDRANALWAAMLQDADKAADADTTQKLGFSRFSRNPSKDSDPKAGLEGLGANSSMDGYLEGPIDASMPGYITREQLAVIVDRLAKTWQLPSKCRVYQESSFPHPRHRERKPDEFVQEALKRLKLGGSEVQNPSDAAQQRIDYETFRRLLFSREICAWGECFDDDFIELENKRAKRLASQEAGD